MTRIFSAAFSVVVVAFLASGVFVRGDGKWRETTATPIDTVQIFPGEFGPSLSEYNTSDSSPRFVGGLILRSSNPNFGALSGLRIGNDGLMTTVTDTGFWFQGQIQRDADGIPTGISKGRMAPLRDDKGQPFTQKWFGDAEGLTFKDGAAYVSTEQNSRIIRYEIESDLLGSSSRIFGPPLPGERLAYNFGLEAIATIPEGSPDAGQLLVVAEMPGDRSDQMRAFIVNQKHIEEIGVARRDNFAITDADFTKDGLLLLLERRFSPANGPELRLRKIKWPETRVKNSLDGEIILKLDRRWQIDNMEGLSVFTGPDGTMRLGMVSDSNQWPLQRTLYLEFKLGDQAKQ